MNDLPCAKCGAERTNYGFPKCPVCKNPWPPSLLNDLIVRDYDSHEAYAREAPYMTQNGYTIVSVVETKQRSGCGRFFALGLLALVFPPKPHILVTYQRSQTAAPSLPDTSRVPASASLDRA